MSDITISREARTGKGGKLSTFSLSLTLQSCTILLPLFKKNGLSLFICKHRLADGCLATRARFIFSQSPPSILTLSWDSYAERGKSILHLSRVASGHFWGLQMSQLHKVSSGSFWGAIERTGQRLGKDKRVKCSNGESNITCLPTGPG